RDRAPARRPPAEAAGGQARRRGPAVGQEAPV
ncbi:MAG: hypothetical protein AVDCRST_MAG41-2894, partial [uncultured Corynebacteriales bacterium]